MKRLLWLCVLLCGCAKLMGYSDGGTKSKEPIRQYAGSPEGLQALWADVLEAARKDDRERVHELLATLVMSDEELAALLGPRGTQLAPRYHKLMETLVHRGAIEMVAQVYERKYDAVEVLPIEMSGAIVNSTPADRVVGRALIMPTPIYAVRLKRAGDNRGLRYDFFLFHNGHWRTGNQLGQFLEESRDGG